MKSLGVDHRPYPIALRADRVLRQGSVFDGCAADELISAFGASVESVEEGFICLEQRASPLYKSSSTSSTEAG